MVAAAGVSSGGCGNYGGRGCNFSGDCVGVMGLHVPFLSALFCAHRGHQNGGAGGLGWEG